MASAKTSDFLDRPLADCPVRKGFRQRGVDMTRMETFTDAAFAFAATLLVISIDAVPTTVSELIFALRDIPAFGVSFLILMLFWHGHWTWSRRFGLEDTGSIWLSGILVFVVLCSVYPLKYINGLFMFWLSREYLSPAVGDPSFTPADLYYAFAIYAVGFASLSLVIILLNLRAWRLRDALQLNAIERFDTVVEILAWLVTMLVGLLSLAFALLTTPSAIALPGWAYMLLAIVMPIFGIVAGKRRKRLEAEVPAKTGPVTSS